MKLSLFGRMALALVASLALGLGMTACGGGTIGYIWVIGSQYNQIAGFKVDDYTGNLTQIPGAPFSVSGANPVSILVRPGGRYLYVLNQGSGGSQGVKGASSGISVFAVGGDGTLTYEIGYQSQGFVPIYMQFDSTGSFLYVLDKYSPSGNGNGSITAFQIDPNTGRLVLVTNSQTQVNGVNTAYFEVGANPIMMKSTGACLFTVNGVASQSGESITPYGINGGNGQLTVATNGVFPVPATTISSITGSSNFIFLTDTSSNTILPFTVGSGCSLTSFTGGVVNNIAGTANPVYTFFDNSSKYLYVLNQGNGSITTPNSTISGFTFTATTQQLTPLPGAPYPVGSGPVCMVEDNSNKYVYISNHNDGTVTGKVIDPTTGRLSDLSRGSSFNATGQAGCLVLSGAVSN